MAGVLSLMWSICVQYIMGTVCGWIVFLMSSGQGCDKTPVCFPGQVNSCAGQADLPGNLPEGQVRFSPRHIYLSNFTLRYLELIRRQLLFVVHSKGETNSGQVDLN